MPADKFQSVDEYIAAQPEPVQAVLERVRAAIRKALPGADETISYTMPTYSLRGNFIIHFAAWKRHFSLYPASAKLIWSFKKELAAATLIKNTIRFPLTEPVPTALIERIAKFRVKEQEERAKRKASGARTAGSNSKRR
ncbi:MAG TPA: DUF1801 domain-containing protein [Rhizomicrobium sp.]|nr:DUF1801 domain-containing protein [Rhizomicrobium sp.]